MATSACPSASSAPDGSEDDRPWRKGRTAPLARPSPSEIRDASRSFRKDTVVAFDGVAMRHYDLLSDPALEIIADVFEVMEATGEMPQQLGLTEMPMISKARGGHRAVASIVGLYRLWAKVRKPLVTAWKLANDRPYLAAGEGWSPTPPFGGRHVRRRRP